MKKMVRSTAKLAALLLALTGVGFAANHDVYSVTYDSGSDGPDAPSADLALDNDFTRINSVLTGPSIADGDSVTLYGTFDWAETNARASYENPTGVTIGYTWNLADLQGLRPKASLAGINLQGEPGVGAEVIAPKDIEDDMIEQSFLAIGGQTNYGWIVKDLTLKYFERAIAFGNSGVAEDWQINDNTFYIGSYRGWISVAIHVRNYNKSNITVDGNTFYHIVNAGNYEGPTGLNYGLTGVTQAIRVDCCNANQFKNATITNNVFQAMFEDKDGNGTVDPAERIRTNQMHCIDDNNNASAGTLTVSDNVFDGTVLDEFGQEIPAGSEAFRCSQKPDTFSTGAGLSNTIYEGNSFKNFFVCFYPRVFNPGVDAQTLILGGNTFVDCGYNDEDNPQVLYYYPDKWGTSNEITYAAAILNARGSAYSGSGGSNVVLNDIDNFSWEGTTGIPMLNDIAVDGRAFESISLLDGNDGTAQAGILAARVEPAAATTYNNSAWTYEDRFARPTPEQDGGGTDLSGVELAFGYNAFGDVIDEGDPNEFIVDQDPTADGDGDNSLLTIRIAVDTEIAPGTIVDKDTLIIRDTIKTGAGSAPAISSKVKKLSSALFIVQAGASLEVRDLVLDGNTPFTGPRDVRTAVELEDGAGQVVLSNVTLRNFFAEIITPNNGADVAIDNAILELSGGLVKPPVGKVVGNFAVTNSTIQNLFDNAVITTSGGAYLFDGNVWIDNAGQTTFYIVGTPADLQIGAPGNGNIFFDTLAMTFNGASPAPASLAFENNWHDIIYAEGVNDDNGIVIGNQDLARLGSDIPVITGTRTHDRVGNLVFIESDIIAQFDRDLDALPDAWEIGTTIDYTAFDTDNDGWPDGVEVAEGTNPDDNSDYPAGDFSAMVNVDANANGYADWYEEALATNVGIFPFLGQVTGTTSTPGLSDAVRSLQIVNGAFGDKDLYDGDINALDVTALGPNSLGNPLQILRFQAGVRNKLPALAGID